MKYIILILLLLYPVQVQAVTAVRVRRTIKTQVKARSSARGSVLINAERLSPKRSDSNDLSAPKGERVYTWEDMQPIIAVKARKAGIHPAVAVGQAANESMHGRATLATEYNNFFGIKGTGSAGTVEMNTSECADGKCFKTKAHFAAYKTPQDSIDAYIRIVKGMLKGCGSSEPKAQLACIWKGGYATSLAYVDHVSAVKEYEDYNY